VSEVKDAENERVVDNDGLKPIEFTDGNDGGVAHG